MNLQEARAQFLADKPMLESLGIILPGVQRYLTDAEKRDYRLGMDAQPLLSTDPNSAIPAMLTTAIDPDIIRVVFAPLAFAEILGERKAGDWLEDTRMFPVVEQTGEVSSYGDFNNNGSTGINMNWPQFQSYLFQTFVQYGERELERAGLAKINYVSELNVAATTILNRFQNEMYAYGIEGLQNYGILNNPYLSALLTPGLKAAGGTSWFLNGAPNATANEVYNDIVAVWAQLIAQGNGSIDLKAKATLAMSPGSEVALTFTNSFGVNVSDLLKKNYPNMTVKTAPQYGVQTASAPDGQAAGNLMQLWHLARKHERIAAVRLGGPDGVEAQTIGFLHGLEGAGWRAR